MISAHLPILSHGQALKGVRNVYSLHNDHVRDAAQFMANHGILCDYHSLEVSLVTAEGLSEVYPKMSEFWAYNFLYKYSSFFLVIPLSLFS